MIQATESSEKKFEIGHAVWRWSSGAVSVATCALFVKHAGLTMLAEGGVAGPFRFSLWVSLEHLDSVREIVHLSGFLIQFALLPFDYCPASELVDLSPQTETRAI